VYGKTFNTIIYTTDCFFVLDVRANQDHSVLVRQQEAICGAVKPVNERQARRFAQEPELVSIKATQALLGDVSDKTVRRLVKTGRIEAVKVGARLMPRLASVRSFARGE
jgi:Helix-turn-helix domain